MHRFRLIFLVMAVLAGQVATTAQNLDVPVATVRLVRAEVISQRDFRSKATRLERMAQNPMTDQDRRRLLDVLISEVLLGQAAERAGVRATDAEVMAFAKATARVPATVSDQDFRRMIEGQSGTTWANFFGEARKSFITQRFIMTRPEAAALQAVEVSESRVNDFYNENRSQFMNPDMVRVSHIFFDTKQRPRGTLAEIRARANAAMARLSNNEATFEELVRTESEDEASKIRNGDLGFVARADAQAVALFGREFINQLFGMRKGTSATTVMESNAGLHIVRVTDRLDQRFLAITDRITPLDPRTVRDFIRAQLTAQDQQARLQGIIENIVEELKKEADIRSFPQNF